MDTGLKTSGGEGGIRTLGTGVSPYNGLANRRIRPLCHLSDFVINYLQTSISEVLCNAVQKLISDSFSVLPASCLRSYATYSSPTAFTARACPSGVRPM